MKKGGIKSRELSVEVLLSEEVNKDAVECVNVFEERAKSGTRGLTSDKKVRNDARCMTEYSNAGEKMEIWISKCREMQVMLKFWDDVRLQLVHDDDILAPTLHG